MHALERLIEHMVEVIDEMTSVEILQVERSLRQLTRRQILFVHDALKIARLEERMQPHHISFLDYLFQEWWECSLATKLAAIARVVSLSDSAAWPGNATGDRIIADLAKRCDPFAIAVPPHNRDLRIAN